MKFAKEIRKRIDLKRSEMDKLREEKDLIKRKIDSFENYISGLQEALNLMSEEEEGSNIRQGTMPFQAREILRTAEKPLHVKELLEAMDKPFTKETRAGLVGSLGAYVRKNSVFTRPAPNTFGLVEFELNQLKAEKFLERQVENIEPQTTNTNDPP